MTRSSLLRTLGIWSLPAALLAAPGTLKPLKGTVSIQTSGKTAWNDITDETPVEEGTRIRTGTDAAAFLTTPDDHRVALGSLTFITLQRLASGQTKIYLKEGSIRNKVRKLNIDLGQFYKVQ